MMYQIQHPIIVNWLTNEESGKEYINQLSDYTGTVRYLISAKYRAEDPSLINETLGGIADQIWVTETPNIKQF